ncbi:MAG: hypothetical protein KDA76_08850 [Planctomycetaceae bacterium]|nr:hypothetical protein [Planctomycetaceae bacterium]
MKGFLVTLAGALAICIGSPGEMWGQARRVPPAGQSAGGSVVAEYKSANFIVRTDLTAKEAQELLERLETMLGLISRYWGKKNAQVIEMYVVKNLANWPAGMLSPEGRESVASGGGVTSTQKRTLGRAWQAKSIVYAVADRGTPQHEAVHAYCAQTFGSTGPTWYSEGMAEVGQYWRGAEDKSVNCHDHVIAYLKSGEPKPLKDVVDLAQFTGDSWQNYAWRWSLCHLLGFNENYTARFKPLGLALMAEQQGVTFWTVYGTMAAEIEFEHRLFLQNLEPGYRVDLCSWDWKTKPQRVRGSRVLVSKVEAARGWQATRLEAQQGETYAYTAEGTWTLEKDAKPLSADGDESGKGRLLAVYFDDYSLSEPFELAAQGTFTATQDGQIFVRCREDWGSLADNSGALSLKFKLSQ